MKRRFKPFLLFLVLSLFSLSLFIPVPNADAAGGDISPVGECQGLGQDIDANVSSINPLIASDFKVTMINRSEVLVETVSPNKTFFTTGAGVTYGEIFGEGCIITDKELDDTFRWETEKVMISFDQARYKDNGEEVLDDTKSVPNNLGSIDASRGLTLELNWVVVADLPDGIISWANGAWTTNSEDSDSGLKVDVQNAEMFNLSLDISGNEEEITLTDTGLEDVVTFSGSTKLFRDTQDSSSDCLTFPQGQSATTLLAATDFVRLTYDKNCDGNGDGNVDVLGGAGQTANQGNLPEGLLANVGVTGSSSCEEAVEIAFNFILCPLLLASNSLIGWVDDRILSALSVDNDYFNNPQVKNAWGNMRNIAYIILIPIMLVMVISTALGFNFLNAYTVKRAVPRLFIAAIFIALSYDICRIMIEMTNEIGRGVAGLIAAPFGGMENLTLANIFSPGNISGYASWGILAFIGASFIPGANAYRGARTNIWEYVSGKVAGAAWVALAITLGLAALMLLTIFALLAFREMFIIFLLVISPLAILAWIFPGNDKPWKFWWGSFSKLLLLFPIIAGVIAMGRAFASIVGSAGNADPVFGTIIKLVAVIGPYFFIPKAFQMAGSAFGSVVGMVNNREKGVFDRMRKSRQGFKERKAKDALSGNAYKGAPEGSFRGSLNRRAQQAALLKKAGYRPSRIGSAATLNSRDELDHIMKDTELAGTIANDDAGNAVLQGRGTREDFYNHLTSVGYNEHDAGRIADELAIKVREHGLESVRAAAVIQLAGSKTAFRGGPAEMAQAIMDAAGGDTQMAATLYARARSAAEAGQRLDLAGYSYGDGLVEMQKIWNASDEDRDSIAEDVNMKLLGAAYDSKSSGQVWSGHGTAVKNFAKVAQTRFMAVENAYQEAKIEATQNPGDQAAQARLIEANRDRAFALAEIATINDQIGYFSPENQREFTDAITNIGLTERYIDDDGSVKTRAMGNEMIEVQVPIYEIDDLGRVKYDTATNQPIVREIRTESRRANGEREVTNPLTLVEQYRDNPDFRSRHRELSPTDQERASRLGSPGVGPPV